MLRLDFVAPGTLLGLFGGELKRLTLRQPAEALHWGVELQGEKFIKPRRDRGTGRTSSGFVEVPLRNDRRVLNVAELAARLDPEESPEKVRSPAWFALAMTQGGSSVTYTFNWRK
ncbi:MAG: hypothetical protein HY909_03870 [Deltaproteobacteria bacterium]|nr:hypothetical protein [Deltaproteobacteria bacterium]